MKKNLILALTIAVIIFILFFNVKTSEVAEPSLVVSRNDLIEIVKQVDRLNLDDFGYKRLMLFMSKNPAVEDLLVEKVVMKRNLFDIVVGLKSYEIIVSYKKRPAMVVSVDYRNDKLHSVDYASILDYDSIKPIH